MYGRVGGEYQMSSNGLVFCCVYTQADQEVELLELNVKAVWGQFLVTNIPNAYTNE